VSVDNLSVIETGLQSIEQSVDKYTHAVTSQKTTATFFVAKGNRPLIIKSQSDSKASQYTGALVPVPADVRAYFQKEFLDARHKQFDEVFAPFLLDATDFRGNAYIGLAICIPIGLLAAWNVKKAVARIQNVQNSPIYKWLDHYGQPPEVVAQAIDQEIKNYKDGSPISSITLLPSWMLHESFFHFTTLHLNEVVWVHQKITRHSVHFIPTGKSFAIVIRDAYGRTIEVDAGRGSEQVVSGFALALKMRMPWAASGYSDELKSLYTHRRRDFAGIVNTRRIEYMRNMAACAAEG
jgi:hypothetical protein